MAKYSKGRMYGRKNKKGIGSYGIAGTTDPNKLNYGQGHIGTSAHGGMGGAQGNPSRPGAYGMMHKNVGGYGGV